MKIVIDAMGGDYAPAAIVEGAVQAICDLDTKIVLVGRSDAIQKELKRHSYPQEKIEIVDAQEVVGMDEPATVSIRKKRNSSITVGINLLKDPQYNAFISAGNTGAVVAAATVHLGMLPQVERPAIGLVIPTLKDFAFLIDVGANTDPKPQHLLQSALMAQVYVRDLLGYENPRVGLLNIGEEATKGTDFVKETHKMMSERIKNFIGNVEANEIFDGKCDCIICDGFVGNVVIKVAESLMEAAMELIRGQIKKNPITLLGALLMKPGLRDVKRHADYSEYGGAPLLGVNGFVMISHGRSSPKAIKNAIKATQREVKNNILNSLANEVGVGQ